jgi:hypothetical protein
MYLYLNILQRVFVQSSLCNRRMNNGIMQQPLSRQLIVKHIPTAKELLLEKVFSTRSV